MNSRDKQEAIRKRSAAAKKKLSPAECRKFIEDNWEIWLTRQIGLLKTKDKKALRKELYINTKQIEDTKTQLQYHMGLKKSSNSMGASLPRSNAICNCECSIKARQKFQDAINKKLRESK